MVTVNNMNDFIPKNMDIYYETMPLEIEKEYKDVNSIIDFYFQSKNAFDYSFIIIKVMESVEDLKNVSGKYKKNIAIEIAKGDSNIVQEVGQVD